jgi:steroid 5-alpha reductase family enzyme
MTRFKANPANRGKVLNTGVWRYTRHPNCFGDAAQWWGHYFVATAASVGFWTIGFPANRKRNCKRSQQETRAAPRRNGSAYE